MIKKYELLKDEYIEYEGRILYRLKALKAFGDIKLGDKGGYIETENNLSHDGDCWVHNKAKVYDRAEVFGDAHIYNQAEVYENARICGKALICDNALIYGNAKITEQAKVYGQARVYDNSFIFERARIYDNANIFGDAFVYGNANILVEAKIFGSARISKGNIIGQVSMEYKNIFQYRFTNNVLTAILNNNNNILYSIDCKNSITEEQFREYICNGNIHLGEYESAKEYLSLIPLINSYFEGGK